jgi:rubrerythrin
MKDYKVGKVVIFSTGGRLGLDPKYYNQHICWECNTLFEVKYYANEGDSTTMECPICLAMAKAKIDA